MINLISRSDLGISQGRFRLNALVYKGNSVHVPYDLPASEFKPPPTEQ